jgi:hypothetical protein
LGFWILCSEVRGGGSEVMIEDSEKWHKGLGSRVWDLELRVKG